MSAALTDAGSVALARTIRPALAHGSEFASESTRASIEKLPVTLFHAKWKASAIAQISRPLALTVNDSPPSAGPSPVALPAMPTAPTSACDHPFGSVPVGPPAIAKLTELLLTGVLPDPLTLIRAVVVGGSGSFQVHDVVATGTLAHSAIAEKFD